MKRKISVTTGSRAEYGILRPVLHRINSSKKLQLCLIVTGMHLSKKHGLTINEIKRDGFKISAYVDMIPKTDSTQLTTRKLGEGVMEFSKIFSKLKPDINLILGDRDEMLASALAAYHMNIPNAHIHGGDRSGGIDEYTRHAITKISNMHFAATEKSKQRIIKMGENPKFVFMTGSPSADEVLDNKISSKKSLEKKYHIRFTGEEILLVQHPVTTQIKSTENQIRYTLKAIVKTKKNTLAIAPNSDPGHKKIFEQLKSFSRKYDLIKFYPTLPRNDYLGMLKNCGVLVGNSSSGLIEASYFNIPVVNIGIRQIERERGDNVIDVKEDASTIYHAIIRALKMKKSKKNTKKYLYGRGTTSYRIIKYLVNTPINNELLHKKLAY